MESVTDSNSMDLKVTELLNEVRLDYSPALTKHVNDTVSAIKDAIDKMPEDFQVLSLSSVWLPRKKKKAELFIIQVSFKKNLVVIN
jgi:hypothetical protein